MGKEKISYFAHLTITVIGILLMLYLIFKYLIVLALPFVIAWCVAFSVRPMAKKVSEATEIPYRFVSSGLTGIIILVTLSGVISAIVYAGSEAWGFLISLAEGDELFGVLEKVLNPIRGFLGDREGSAELEAHIGEAVNGMLTSLLSSLVGVLGALIRDIPKFLIFMLITVIASIYFSLDLERINGFLCRLLPQKATKTLVNIKNRFLSSIVKYLRAYFIIMIFTFMIMLFGFLVLGIKYSVLFAFIVALLDALPLIGVGTVLVPWSTYQLIFGNTRLGIGLLVLLVVQQILRRFIEPKILGKHLGIHPIASLFFLYAGYVILGLWGLLLIPLFSVMINILVNKDDTSKVG